MDELQREGQRIPNLTHPEVPRGGEEVAVIRKEVSGALGSCGMVSLAGTDWVAAT